MPLVLGLEFVDECDLLSLFLFIVGAADDVLQVLAPLLLGSGHLPLQHQPTLLQQTVLLLAHLLNLTPREPGRSGRSARVMVPKAAAG